MKQAILMCGLLAFLVNCYTPAEPLRRSSTRPKNGNGSAAADNEKLGGNNDQDNENDADETDHSNHKDHAPDGPAPDDGSKPSTGTDVFSGAPAFTPGKPAHSANDHHDSSMTGRACLDCHTGTTAPKFLFGGTIYRASKPLAGAQVRVVDASGNVQGSTFSDADGNFWVQSGAALKTGGRTGARTADTKGMMQTQISNGNCNSSNCHGGTSSRITMP